MMHWQLKVGGKKGLTMPRGYCHKLRLNKVKRSIQFNASILILSTVLHKGTNDWNQKLVTVFHNIKGYKYLTVTLFTGRWEHLIHFMKGQNCWFNAPLSQVTHPFHFKHAINALMHWFRLKSSEWGIQSHKLSSNGLFRWSSLEMFSRVTEFVYLTFNSNMGSL